MPNFNYNCPHCDEEMTGSFGDNVYCPNCDKTYETEWEYVTEDYFGWWLTGKEMDGKVDLPTES